MAKDVLGIYVHIPFCRRKCRYCSFFSTTEYSTELIERYINALGLSFQTQFEKLDSGAKDFTLYIGGGTPSLLEPVQFSRLMKIFSGLDFVEATIEVNPDSITEDKLKVWKDSGITRVSIGVQSFNDSLLHFLGRLHDSRTGLAAINMASKYFQAINVDIMFAIPGQDIESLANDLGMLTKLGVPHISAYELTIEEGTPLYVTGVKIADDLAAQMYVFIHDFLTENGFRHYEISNYAKPGYECLHNINYWRNGLYIGLGAGAVGFDGQYRYKFIEDVEGYVEDPKIVQKEASDDFERIMLGLRWSGGVPKDILSAHSKALQTALDMKWLKIDGKFARPTLQGFLFNNELCGLFLA